MEPTGKIRMGLTMSAFAALLIICGACATATGGGAEDGSDAITIRFENLTNRMVAVERIVAAGATQPVTVRVAMVRGETEQTLTIPWHPSRMAHQLLWFDGLSGSTYRVEECLGEGPTACSQTTGLHLPRGAEVSVVVDSRLEVTMYYRVPSG